MSSSVELNPRPVRVSPLIKFSRWTFLTVGILYGAYFQRKFSRIENARREKEERERPAREAREAVERAMKLEAEKKMIEDLLKTNK
ncbi:ATP synthase subunit e, mitochondrial [Polistes fuscatus]|uniref:ATP synthase subunit e, mitochondrial n=1 Tax=Polistes fuscatus TaxID=30207 RepID=UPI001CA7EC07|nr:ATP synthase subunit e, mitochondrial [Polistes fuscatus]